jgi:hypothetical protein
LECFFASSFYFANFRPPLYFFQTKIRYTLANVLVILQEQDPELFAAFFRFCGVPPSQQPDPTRRLTLTELVGLAIQILPGPV